MRHRHSQPTHDRRFARGPSRGDGPDHHHEGGRSRHRDERGGRRPSRLFDHGELRLVVLALIAEQPRHGYELIKEIEDRAAGTYTPSPGVIYPTLTMLEEIGHATLAESGGKKLYTIAPDGTAYLAANKPAVDAALGRMQAVSMAHSGGPAPDIIRATENLKLALRLRLGRGPLSEGQIRAIAAALDIAAVAIEQS
ncbi:PadR family transcriptional regulator [Acidisphaera sp. L21]|uniref:PadR family transcriptional regulator n=1 Tax=Acidisphaera sp. L21 TaxID=1641851 RepID=UPI00131EBC29|nr:PadR family transcriptional regulator [Acidisphaera sp. L21]